MKITFYCKGFKSW